VVLSVVRKACQQGVDLLVGEDVRLVDTHCLIVNSGTVLDHQRDFEGRPDRATNCQHAVIFEQTGVVVVTKRSKCSLGELASPIRFVGGDWDFVTDEGDEVV